MKILKEGRISILEGKLVVEGFHIDCEHKPVDRYNFANLINNYINNAIKDGTKLSGCAFLNVDIDNSDKSIVRQVILEPSERMVIPFKK